MQVTEVSAQGLKREYRIVVPAGEIDNRVKTRLERLQRTMRMPGFRPGKAPLPLLRKQYGRSLLSEVLQEAVDEGTKRTVDDNQLRPAMRPEIVPVGEFDEGRDLEFQVNLEVLPEVPEVDLEAVEITRLAAEVDDVRVDETVERLARARQQYAPPAEPRPAAEGDQLVIDFDGAIDGQPFAGGSGKEFALVLGGRGMIPGFEEGLAGASAGERRQVAVTFPADYGAAEVAGKDAVFDVLVREVREPRPVSLDDEFAKGMGAEGLDDLKRQVRERFAEQYRDAARTRMKRALLDQLSDRYRFEVPQGMVEAEFQSIWKQLKEELERAGDAAAAAEERAKPEAELEAEYRAIAERRVRLGLILSDLGTKNGSASRARSCSGRSCARRSGSRGRSGRCSSSSARTRGRWSSSGRPSTRTRSAT
jgi:trigger factor